MTSFLIARHRKTWDTVVTAFNDGGDAMNARFTLEHVTRGGDWEIVVLTAADLATIQQTHSRYFAGDWKLIA